MPGCSTALDSTDVVKAYSKPYLSFYGGDVCTNAGVKAFYDTNGSGSQLATFANDAITGYATAKMRNSVPMPLKGLAFANTLTDGGGMTAPPCIAVDSPDYNQPDTAVEWGGMPSTAVDRDYYYAGCAGNNNAAQMAASGAINVPQGARITLYIPCDLVITNNIHYVSSDATVPSYTSLSQVPSFTVIVQGNIYINKAVTELNGTYIAQTRSSGSGGGTIYTCVNGISASPAPWLDLRANCKDNQLKVYGALYAKKIRWWRMFGTMNGYGATRTEEYSATQAAEAVIDSPLRYLKQPTNTQSSNYFDSYTSLSPIL